VLADGGHAERSPMYHAIAMADLFEAILLARAVSAPVPPAMLSVAGRMWHAWLRLSRPDGLPHLLNDSADGIAPSHGYLETLARRLWTDLPEEPGVSGGWALRDSGFVGWRNDGRVLVADVGPPGPQHQPAHSHCGALGYEWDTGGQRVLVDSGVAGYDDDPLRSYVRSTRAHNTVMVAEREQSENWGTFRVGGRASVSLLAFESGPEEAVVEALCRPFGSGGVRHRRKIRCSAAGLTVEDEVEPAGIPFQDFLHFHPAFAMVEESSDGMVLEAGELRIRVTFEGAVACEVDRGESDAPTAWYCPAFGVRIPAPVVTLAGTGGVPIRYCIEVDGDRDGGGRTP
jgi:uncharacterized heparinase superfamily protein